MVSSQLIGRLGNSMFQIAASIGYARKYGYEWAVQETPHNNESAIHKVFHNLPKTTLKGVRFQEHLNEHCAQHGTHKDLCHFDYHEIPDVGKDVFFSGFWQSYKYFEHCQEEIKEVFKLPHVEGYEDYVSIHVRRGDYVQYSGSFPPITNEYIVNALKKIFDIKGICNVYWFSDDMDYVRNEMLPKIAPKLPNSFHRYEYNFTEFDVLSHMSSCGHHIIANSSFSWWAAYQGHNHNRIVISPSAKTWFGPTSGVKRPVVDLILPEWIQIDTR